MEEFRYLLGFDNCTPI